MNYYAREKIGAAVEVMATSGAKLQERLQLAFTIFGTLNHSDFQQDAQRKLFKKIKTAMTSRQKPVNSAGAVADTMRKIRRVTAERIAADVWQLHCSLEFEFRVGQKVE